MKELIKKLETMSEQELRELNDAVVSRLKYVIKSRNLVSAGNFKIGDKVFFEDKKGRKITITVDEIKKGNLYGKEGFINWKVSASICKLC